MTRKLFRKAKSSLVTRYTTPDLGILYTVYPNARIVIPDEGAWTELQHIGLRMFRRTTKMFGITGMFQVEIKDRQGVGHSGIKAINDLIKSRFKPGTQWRSNDKVYTVSTVTFTDIFPDGQGNVSKYIRIFWETIV